MNYHEYERWAWNVAQLATQKGIELPKLGIDEQIAMDEFQKDVTPKEFLKQLTESAKDSN